MKPTCLQSSLARILDWLRRDRPRRYRVTPRQNPAVFRRHLLRDVRSQLALAAVLPWSRRRGTSE